MVERITMPTSEQSVITEKNLFTNTWFLFLEKLYRSSTATTGAITYADLFAVAPITYDGAGTYSTSMTTNKLIGRYTAGTGVMEEISLDPATLVLSAGVLTAIGATPSGAAGGDLSGLYPNPTVAKINGVALGSTAASSGNILIGSGTTWVTNAVSGDVTLNSTGTVTLATVNSNVGTFGSATQVPQFTVNAKGLVTAVTNVTISGVVPGSIALNSGQIIVGDVSNVGAAVSMSGDATIINTGALTLATVNSNIGTFGDATHISQVTVNAKGLITAVSSVLITGAPPTGAAGGDLSGTYPNPTVAKINGVALGSTTATSGNLLIGSGTAWVTNTMSGDATINSTGVLTIANSAITNAKMANMANNTIKGNKSGGAAAPSDLDISDVTETTSNILTITNGTKAIIGASNLTIQVKQAATAQSGYLSSTDWNTFNSKLTATLASGNIWVGNVSNVATAVAMSGDITINNTGVTAIGTNKVLDTMLRQSAGLSVIGRATNTTGNVADITAANDFEILRRSGTSIAFGSINLASTNAVGSSILANANTTADAANTANAIITRDSGGNFAATKASLTTLAVSGITTLGPSAAVTLSNRLTIIGSINDASTGPHIIAYTGSDIYPLYQNLNLAHDSIALSFDAYYDNIWRSSYSGSNFQMVKAANQFGFYYNSGTTAGTGMAWTNAGFIDCTNGSLTWANPIKANDTTDSSSASTGSLVVTGGAGIAKKLYVGSTTDASSTTVGAFVISGGAAIAKSVYIGGILNVTDTTNSTSITTGCEVLAGGLGVAKKIYGGDSIDIVGAGSASSMVSNVGMFRSPAAGTIGNIFSICVESIGNDKIVMGVNKSTATGNVPASCNFITTYNSSGGIAFGRGNGSGLPSTVDMFIDAAGLVGIGNFGGTVSALLVYENSTRTSTTAGLTVQNLGAGDAVTHYVVGAGTTTWSSGIDNSLSGDPYVIAASADLGTTPLLKITTGGLFSIIINSALSATDFGLSLPWGDGNFINVGGGGRNIGVFNLGAHFKTFGLDYDATANSYLYSNTGVAATAIELNQTAITLKYAASGTAGNSVTPSTGFALTTTGNAAFFGAGSFGGGLGVVFIANATTVPTTNPSGGGLPYVTAGAFKYRGSSGTVTNLGNADPHCKKCQSDFGLGWNNPRYGGEMLVCKVCETEFLDNLRKCIGYIANDNKAALAGMKDFLSDDISHVVWNIDREDQYKNIRIPLDVGKIMADEVVARSNV